MADVFPPQYDTPLGMVRALIPDVATPYILSDDQIGVYLTVQNNNVKRAAAQAIDVLASDTAYLLVALRTDDLSVDGAKTAEALRKQAQALRDSADADDASAAADAFTVVYPTTSTVWPEGVPVTYGRIVGVGPVWS